MKVTIPQSAILLLACILLACTGCNENKNKEIARQYTDRAMETFHNLSLSEESLALIDSSLAYDPSLVNNYGTKVMLLNRLQRYDDAIRVYEELDQRGYLRDIPEYMLGYGLELALVGDTISAQKRWQDAMDSYNARLKDSVQLGDVMNMILLYRMLNGKSGVEEYASQLSKSFAPEEQEQLMKVLTILPQTKGIELVKTVLSLNESESIYEEVTTPDENEGAVVKKQ